MPGFSETKGRNLPTFGRGEFSADLLEDELPVRREKTFPNRDFDEFWLVRGVYSLELEVELGEGL